MGLKPVRTMKLSMNAELARRAGDHLVVSVTSPDRTLIFDLNAWPLIPRELPGLFCPQLDARDDGTLLAVARHHHPNPYRPYVLDPRSASVAPLKVETAWRDVNAAFSVGRDALLVQSRGADGFVCGWWRDGAVQSLPLPRAEEPGFVEHGGKKLAMPPRTDTLDAFALPGDEALVIWQERLHRVSRDAVTPLPPDHLFSLASPLRDGRHTGLDAAGRALTVVHDRFVAIDREGAITLASPGSDAVRGLAPGPDGMWFLVGIEVVHVVLPDAEAVIELDLSEMRMAPRMPLYTPKAVYAPARHALLVVHDRDVWEFDLAAVLREKAIPFAKHAEKLAAARRTTWSRKVRSAKTAAIPLDALSMSLRGGGTLVDHPTHGRGVTVHASEMRRAGALTVSAIVLFETGPRTFVYMGDRWQERPWYFG